MGPLDNQDAMDPTDAARGLHDAESLGASSDTMNDFDTADTLGMADESIGQVDATDQNELERSAGARPGDRTDTRTDEGVPE